jgi:hypothetical protein
VNQTFTWVGDFEDGSGAKVPLFACNGCGALVKDEDKHTHDTFHDALAELWNQLS